MKQSVTRSIKQSVTMKQSVTIKQSVTMKQSVTLFMDMWRVKTYIS